MKQYKHNGKWYDEGTAQDEREAFEAEARKLLYVLDREAIGGEYIVPDTENAWHLWRARDTRPAQTDELQEAREELARVRAELEVFTTSVRRRESELSAELDHVKQVNAELMQGLKRLLRLGNGGTLFTAEHLDSVVNGYFGSKAELALRHAIK